MCQGCGVEGRLSKKDTRKEKRTSCRCECEDDAKELYETILFAPEALFVLQANKFQPPYSRTLDTTSSQPNNSSSHPSITTAVPLLKNHFSSGTNIFKILLSWKTYSTSALSTLSLYNAIYRMGTCKQVVTIRPYWVAPQGRVHK